MKCEECKFAKPFIDIFTQKQRLYCEKELQLVDSFGDAMLVTSEYVTDCEYGELKERDNEKTNR